MALEFLVWVSVLASAYTIGSFPTAYIITAWRRRGDIRLLGDGNAGAANVYRNVGKASGVAVGMVDIGKGTLAILVARQLSGGEMPLEVAAGLAAVAGHVWPLYMRFRGGRAAATALGVLVAFAPGPGIPLALLALAVVIGTRRSTVALAIFFVTMPAAVWITGGSVSAIVYAAALPLLVAAAHFASLRHAPAPTQAIAVDAVSPGVRERR